MIQKVFIIGATGRVGSALVNQIIKKGDIDASHHVNPTVIAGLASSTHIIYSPQGLTEKQAYDFANKKCDEAKKYNNLDELLRIANEEKSNQSTLVFVDVTSLNEPMTEFHRKVISSSKHGIVTANKNPVALSDYSTFQLLTRDTRRYGYRCSVMAGADAVPFLRDLKDLNDKLYSLQGCLSGTLCYLTSELEKGKKFSEIIREARQKGYTEPHPRDDLNGIDVARKMVVLARAAGFPVGIKDVKIKPFTPQEYLAEGNIDSFLDAISELDKNFKERMEHVRKKDFTLRYVAEMNVIDGIPNIQVSLKEVPKQSPLGILEGTLNKIVVVTESYPKGYTIEAPGAGLEVTARNIRRDLLDLLPDRKSVD